MKITFLKTYVLFFTLASVHLINAQINQANVYWVGHSLISHTDTYAIGTDNLINVFGDLSTAGGKTYNYHQHTTPGAPLGWNWGASAAAYADIQTMIQPLTNPSDPSYGTFDAIIITEAIELQGYYQWWSCSFYARKFFNAALNANTNSRLFLYQSWHHFQASDDASRSYYGPMSSFDWEQYMLTVRPVWNAILDESIDPALTSFDAGYSYQGSGTDPGLGNDTLDVCLIPTGEVLVSLFNRMDANVSGDDWSFTGGYNGATMEKIDFFFNPLSNFPTDTITTVHGGAIDDIHPSNVLIYLNALTQYAVVYQENPISLPALNGVPSNVANIFKEVVWDVVINNPRTCVATALDISDISKTQKDVKLFPSIADAYITLEYSGDNVPYQIVNINGSVVATGNSKKVDISYFSKGLYFMKINGSTIKFVKD